MDNIRRSYYLKMTENFFAKPSTVMLMGKGADKLSIYIQMLVTAANTDGKLIYSVSKPYNAGMLAELFNIPKTCVEQTLSLLEDLRLIKILEDGCYFLTELQDMLIVEEEE